MSLYTPEHIVWMERRIKELEAQVSVLEVCAESEATRGNEYEAQIQRVREFREAVEKWPLWASNNDFIMGLDRALDGDEEVNVNLSPSAFGTIVWEEMEDDA